MFVVRGSPTEEGEGRFSLKHTQNRSKESNIGTLVGSFRLPRVRISASIIS